MKAISFIGASRYDPVTYYWREGQEEKEVQTHLFPEAVYRIFQPEKLLVLVTPRARSYKPPGCEKTYLETLEERLGDVVEPVDIPEGRSEAELWEIFSRCAEAVGEGEEILLDVTHAFRSLPLIVFSVAAYLSRAKRVRISRIVYGAYEAREPFRTPPEPTDRAPIFDLTPLLDLLDWLQGVDEFLRRADASGLSQRLREAHSRPWREGEGGELPRALKNVADGLERLSRALHLARPLDIMKEAKGLLPLLEEASKEVERWAKPFATVLERVRMEISQLAHEEPERLDKEHLQKQLAIIRYFLDKGLYAQAVLLAREWMVNWAILQGLEGDWLDGKVREKAEKALGAAHSKVKGGKGGLPEWLASLHYWREVGKLWSWISVNLRNDLAHCGMRKGAASAESVERRAREIPKKLEGLLSGAPERALSTDRVTIDLGSLYEGTARLEELPSYIEKALEMAGEGREVVLTGQAPIWLYLAVAHALHGRAKRLIYSSPVTGEVVIFDHTAR